MIPGPWSCKRFLLMTGFCYAQVLFNTGLSVCAFCFAMSKSENINSFLSIPESVWYPLKSASQLAHL